MLDMCLMTRVFLQVNSCLISKMKGMRYEHVKEEKKRSIVHNSSSRLANHLAGPLYIVLYSVVIQIC
jgi:hypothetical protein